ncbi:hypothetical protein [Sporomusa sp. KB1]|jgi:hypothetical protein|uniref:hypothetical protein n=1 Tax=Sporomusa sp. KB1 TaxID=943346 RepID=UPI0011A5A420|nr:hypothetical protein [Sporomusa sp. KB1]TWH49537.1 hypothetical protein Salpa_5769 [Sporomusa sp. KB1]
MNQEIFADGISAVHVTGNLVRIDLMTVQPHLKSDNGQPVVDISKRIIMPLDGFVQSFSVQENIIKQLIKAGVLKQNPPEAAGVVRLAEKRVDKEPEQQG